MTGAGHEVYARRTTTPKPSGRGLKTFRGDEADRRYYRKRGCLGSENGMASIDESEENS